MSQKRYEMSVNKPEGCIEFAARYVASGLIPFLYSCPGVDPRGEKAYSRDYIHNCAGPLFAVASYFRKDSEEERSAY